MSDLAKNEQTQTVSLDKKTLRRSWFNWVCWGQICYNYERMMGLGFCQCMIPVLKKLYKNDKGKLAEGMTRHLTYYNTENTWGAVIPGMIAALEEQRANHADIDDDSINNLKTALMGPMAGIGDSITQGLVKVILLAMGIGLASQGNPLGPILVVLLFSVYALGVSYATYFSGYKLGKNAVTKILSGGLIKQITEGLGAMGMTVLGCLVATTIPVTTPLSFTVGKNVTKIQSILDQIMPALLPMAIFLGIYALLRKRVKPVTVIIVIFLAAIVLSLCNIMA